MPHDLHQCCSWPFSAPANSEYWLLKKWGTWKTHFTYLLIIYAGLFRDCKVVSFLLFSIGRRKQFKELIYLQRSILLYTMAAWLLSLRLSRNMRPPQRVTFLVQTLDLNSLHKSEHLVCKKYICNPSNVPLILSMLCSAKIRAGGLGCGF